jgi:hypothetical protein
MPAIALSKPDLIMGLLLYTALVFGPLWANYMAGLSRVG